MQNRSAPIFANLSGPDSGRQIAAIVMIVITSTPFQIVYRIILFIHIFMIHFWIVVWGWNIRLCNKPVHKHEFATIFVSKTNTNIASISNLAFKKSVSKF